MLRTNVWREEVSLEVLASIATIVGAIGTFIVAIAALVVSVGALRAQRQALRAQLEALPVSARFGVVVRGDVDCNGVCWVQAWMQNTGAQVYVRDVYQS